jgi:hypothetical protein
MSRFGSDRAAWIAAGFYGAVVLVLWLPFNLHSGMPYETGFVYTSEISRWWNGFLFGADWTRIHTSTFFQAGYLLGELTGFGGSYVPYQIVYAALWFARGLLMFMIVRRLMPGFDAFSYVAGGLVLLHSSDFATGWVGQMPQAAYIFWMLAAFYLLVRGLDESSGVAAGICLTFAIFCEAMTLWTYESPIAIILGAPLLLWRVRPAGKWRAVWWVWYAVPVVYLAAIARRYLTSGGHTYQEAVLRKNWAIGPMLSDWVFNSAASLMFWRWPTQPARLAGEHLAILSGLAVLILLAGLFALGDWSMPSRHMLWSAAGVGLVLLVLSFPVYLLLDSARSLWRTQFLSAIGAALLFAALIGFLADRVAAGWLRFATLAAGTACVAWCGSYSALNKSAEHRRLWEVHRHAMAEVLSVAPRVRSGTLILLTNVPGGALDPFASDSSWFDMALRLAYPGTRVNGVYWHEDGHQAHGGELQLHEGKPDSILAIEYHEHGPASVLPRVNHLFALDADAQRLYDPARRIEPGPPPKRVVLRFQLDRPMY